MNILIVGSDFNAILLAQYLKEQDSNDDIFLTTDKNYKDFGFTPVNIKEGDIDSICDFIKYNQIEFTIVTSQVAIVNGISNVLSKEGFPCFAPTSEASRITYINSVAKKIMYKLKINTPKFGIFDRENIATDYLRNSKFPIVIENDLTLLERKNEVYNSFPKAKLGVQKIFEDNNQKIIIENYLDTEPIYIYFITDGYNAYALLSVEKNRGISHSTMSAPSEKITNDIIRKILNNILYPLLDDIKQFANAYIGIIGLKIKIINGNIYVLEFYNNFQEYDLQVFASIFNDNLLELMQEASQGRLSDRDINISDYYSYTIAINKKEINDNGIEDIFVSEDDNNYIFTSTAPTLNKAKSDLFEILEDNCSDTIYESIKNIEKSKEIRY